MNQKNIILTMLACLNCTHTTHAVDSKPAVTDNTVPDGLKELDLKELQRQYAFTERDISESPRREREEFETALFLLVDQAEIFSKMTYLMAKQHMTDPTVEGVVRTIIEIPDLLRRQEEAFIVKHFDDFWRKGHVITPLLNEKLKERHGLDEKTLYEQYPFLEPKFDDVSRHIMSDTPIKDIKDIKDPVTAKQVLYAYDDRDDLALNQHIRSMNFDGLKKWIDFAKRISMSRYNRVWLVIRRNLIGEDQDLKEKTKMLLAKDPALRSMVKGPEKGESKG